MAPSWFSAPAASTAAAATGTVVTEKRTLSRGAKSGLIAAGIAALFLVCAVSPPPLPQHFLVLTLSVVIGFYVIGKVAHSLHTPLMSITNAISGIIVVGAMTQLASDDYAVKIVAFVAVLLASINVFGGFTVTARGQLEVAGKGAQ